MRKWSSSFPSRLVHAVRDAVIDQLEKEIQRRQDRLDRMDAAVLRSLSETSENLSASITMLRGMDRDRPDDTLSEDA